MKCGKIPQRLMVLVIVEKGGGKLCSFLVLVYLFSNDGGKRVHGTVQLAPGAAGRAFEPENYRVAYCALVMQAMLQLKFLDEQFDIFFFHLYSYCKGLHTTS